MMVAWRGILITTVVMIGCGEPLVSANCAGGYQRVGNACVADDAAVGDGSGEDGSTGGGGTPSCGLGELVCGDQCVDPNDPATCGGCDGSQCSGNTPLCSSGTCVDNCSGLDACGGSCVDLANDPTNCGTCNNQCTSGTCENGVCGPDIFGHTVLIGHDYRAFSPNQDINKLVGNAVVVIPNAAPRVLAYQRDTLLSSIGGTDAALDQRVAGWTKTVVANVSNVPFLLNTHDAFLIYAQHGATDAELIQLGALWQTALNQFVRRGGVVVLLEGPSETNAGTYQILSAADMFTATARQDVPDAADRLELIAPTDQVAPQLPPTFASRPATSSFTDVVETAVVVADSVTGLPVVTHAAVAPSLPE